MSSFQAQPKGISDVTQAMVSGTIDGVDIMVFILVLGGLIGVVNANGRVRIRSDGPDEKTKGHEFCRAVYGCFALWCSAARPAALKRRRWRSGSGSWYRCSSARLRLHRLRRRYLPGRFQGTTFSTINPFSVVISPRTRRASTSWRASEWRVGGCIVGAIVVISYLYWYLQEDQGQPRGFPTPTRIASTSAQLFND